MREAFGLLLIAFIFFFFFIQSFNQKDKIRIYLTSVHNIKALKQKTHFQTQQRNKIF